MSFENPTPLRAGATGTLNGWRVRVAGRVVLGMDDAGETYYWNEFNLVDASGNSATLVFEESDGGGEWKLFREFTPTQPLSAREAATKRVGDSVALDGTPARITLVDQTRVYYIEGEAPEGVEVGDVADYFNVDMGNRMLVASWTGDEIEFYEGLDAPADGVAEAFGFPANLPAARTSLTDTVAPEMGSATRTSRGAFTKIIFVLLAGISLFAARSCYPNRHSSRSASLAPPPKQPAPAFKLANGAHGTLAQHSYTIESQAVVEIARVSGKHDRREYQLRDETNQRALLVNGLSGGSKEWHLFRAVAAPPGFTPYDAATKRRGAPINLDGHTLQVADLFQSKTLSIEGPASDMAPGTVQYGLVAREAGDWLIARWTETQIQFYRGPAVQETDVIAALGRATDKSK
jgi:hypothetical protein